MWIANSPLYCGKLLHFEAGKRCSLHFHKLKDETFYLHNGHLILELREPGGQLTAIEMGAGDSRHIPAGTEHRMTAIEDSDLIEFSTQHFEEDSYRIERGD